MPSIAVRAGGFAPSRRLHSAMAENSRPSPARRWALAAAIGGELVIFSAVAPGFPTLANFFEVTRFSVELGLLAVALTPVLVTGGIDLSVGSMLGLSAVVLGALYRDVHLPMPVAAAAAVGLGCAGGALNALLIAGLNLPPLIVTLASLSLFRGIAEGLTGGAINYTAFPDRFLFLGQGYVFGLVPAQLPLFLVIVAAYGVVLHRSVVGRAWYAIGFAADGARYAGIPTRRRVALAYLLSGLVSGVAAVIYVAHVGQARSDAGSGYEIDAIAAAVLGGTSVFGGRGTIWGTVMGLFAMAVLQNGLHLAALPSELSGVLTGVLLLATIAIDHHSRGGRSGRVRASAVEEGEGVVRNSQVATLCAAILAGSLIVAATNVWLVRSVASGTRAADAGASSTGGRRLVVAMMPKAKGDPYFVSCRAGAEEAAREVGVDLIWDGPTSLDAAWQNSLIENWITRNVDAIAVAVENKAGISTVLRKARGRGIKVVTWDADAEPDARDFFVNQATAEGIANTLTDEAARLLNATGEFAIITGALSAANQNEWIAFIKKRLETTYPHMTLAVIRPSDDDRDKAFAEAQTIVKVYPAVKLLMAISAPAVPGAAEAIRQARRTDVAVIGLSLPNINKPYVHDGIVQTVVLWNTRDLGYLTVSATALALRRGMPPGVDSIAAGRLGTITVRGTEVILGAPLRFTRANIDRFDF
jgi:rhamnose transport system substrate-binding protein